MDFAQHQNDLRAQRRSNRILSAIVGVLSLTVLLCLVVIVSIVGSDRTVIVPPNIDKTFWVTKDKASREPYPWQERRGMRVYRHALERGLLLRPIGSVIYFMPPYVITPEEIELMVTVAREGVEIATCD